MNKHHIVSIAKEYKWESEFPTVPAVRAGNTLYISGQIALGCDGNLVGEGDVRAQTHQCFENIRAILGRAGGSMSDIVKLVSYFSCDMSDEVIKDYFSARSQYFGDYIPASTGLQVTALVYPTVLVEVEAIAVLPDTAM
ncbi:RidA family protein [Paraburkholderia sediminicola]|uniref:RidA family protein n=1 Tax=Paraburkholderia sediminicola TaxID=458836 RepID=UPI0038BD4888